MLFFILISILLNVLLIYFVVRYFKAKPAEPEKKNNINQMPRSFSGNLVAAAHPDPVTGLTKFEHFPECITQSIEQARTNPMVFAILCFEVDEEEKILNHLGPNSASEFYLALGKKLKLLLRSSDVVSLQGKNRYWLLLSYLSSPETCMYVALRLKEAAQKPMPMNDMVVTMTLSMGIVMYPQDGNDAKTLMKYTEESLQIAKQNGKNSYHFHHKELHEMGAREESMVSYLRETESLNSLILYYQPCIDIQTGHVIAIEAVVYLDHPDLALIPFSKFMKPAIYSNRMIEIGEWLINHILLQYKKWMSINNEVPNIILPFTVNQLQNKTFIQNLIDLLQKDSVSTQKIILQVVDGLQGQNAILLEKACPQLEAAGIPLALNLLNLGQSALQNISKFPISYLKIDKKIVNQMLAEDEQILEMIFAIAVPANISVIAEGVDTKNQEAHLRKLGCIYMEGDLFGPPSPASALKLNQS